MEFNVGQRISIQLWRDTKDGKITDVVEFDAGRAKGLSYDEAWLRDCYGEFSNEDGSLYTGILYKYISDDRHTRGWLRPSEVQPLLF